MTNVQNFKYLLGTGGVTEYGFWVFKHIGRFVRICVVEVVFYICLLVAITPVGYTPTHIIYEIMDNYYYNPFGGSRQ